MSDSDRWRRDPLVRGALSYTSRDCGCALAVCGWHSCPRRSVELVRHFGMLDGDDDLAPLVRRLLGEPELRVIHDFATDPELQELFDYPSSLWAVPE